MNGLSKQFAKRQIKKILSFHELQLNWFIYSIKKFLFEQKISRDKIFQQNYNGREYVVKRPNDRQNVAIDYIDG